MVGGMRKKAEMHQGPNMTPMVDIVMCILIFFMLGSTIVGGEMFLSQNVPTGTGPGDGKPGEMRTAVMVPMELLRDGEKTVMVAFGERVELTGAGAKKNEALTSLLLQKRAEMSDKVQLNIRPRNDVPYQDVISVYDACVKARFEKVGFAPAR